MYFHQYTKMVVNGERCFLYPVKSAELFNPILGKIWTNPAIGLKM